MHYRITHTTTYEYSEPVSLCQNLCHLTPARDGALSLSAHLTGHASAPAVLSTRTDYFGNPATFFTVQEPHRELTVTALTGWPCGRRSADARPPRRGKTCASCCRPIATPPRWRRTSSSSIRRHFRPPAPIGCLRRRSFTPGRPCWKGCWS